MTWEHAEELLTRGAALVARDECKLCIRTPNGALWTIYNDAQNDGGVPVLCERGKELL